MAERKQRVATINGREYPLRFELDDLLDLERELPKSAWEVITSGRLTEQIVILHLAIRYKQPNLTRETLRKRLEEHRAAGQPIGPVLRQAFWALIESDLIGEVKDAAELRRVMPDPDLAPEPEDDDTGKAPGGAVPAASGV